MSVSADFRRDVQDRKLTDVYSVLSRYMSLADNFKTFEDSLRYAYQILREQLFQANDTIAYPVSENTESWDETYLGTQTAMLANNFSRERVDHVMKVIAHRRRLSGIMLKSVDGVDEILRTPYHKDMVSPQMPRSYRGSGTIGTLRDMPNNEEAYSIGQSRMSSSQSTADCNMQGNDADCPQVLTDTIRRVIVDYILLRDPEELDKLLSYIEQHIPAVFSGSDNSSADEETIRQVGLLMCGGEVTPDAIRRIAKSFAAPDEDPRPIDNSSPGNNATEDINFGISRYFPRY